MPTSSRDVMAKAMSMLTNVGNDIDDINRETNSLSQVIDTLVTAKEDAQWAGDTNRVNRIKYQLMLRCTMRDVLKKRRNTILREMK
jgi:hypothetical protein